MLADLFRLVELFRAGNYGELESVARKLSGTQPDETVFSNFFKLSKAVLTFKTGVSRLTTQNFEGAAGISDAISKVKNTPTRLIARLLSKIDFLTTEIFGDKL